MGSKLTIGPKVRGFKPDRGRCTLKRDKFRTIPSFRGEVKPSVPCRKILQNVENHFEE
jgi:hypothetical protein